MDSELKCTVRNAHKQWTQTQMHNDKNSRFIKDQEAKEFLSQLGTKTPLELDDILFWKYKE